MPTTATGTVYTTTTVDLGNPHGVMHYTVADNAATGNNLPTVLYAHGAGGASDQMVTLPLWVPMRDWLLDRGFVIVEGIGGAVNGAQNWGNPAALAAYPAYLARTSIDLDLGDVILLGRSMGGLVTAMLYAQDTTGQYAGLINNSGVSTVFVGATSGPKDEGAATGWYFTPAMWNAWGVADVAGLQAAMAADDVIPEDWDDTVWAGKNILFCYGDADTTVPWGTRGGQNLIVNMGQADIARVSVTPGGGHGGSTTSYTDVAAMGQFIADVLGLTPPEPPSGNAHVVSGAYWVGADGARHTVTLR